MRQLRLLLSALTLTASALAGAVEPTEGLPTISPIINGEPATETRPWVSALVRRSASTNVTSRRFCGGTLIAATWVLTAAHCVDEKNAGDYQVVNGRLDLTQPDLVFHDVAEHLIHPYYRDGSQFYDIALIRLATPSSNQIAQLATEQLDDDARGNPLTVLGWGVKSWNENAQCTMHFLDTVMNQGDFTCKTYVYRAGSSSAVLMKTDVTWQQYAQCDARIKALIAGRGIPVPSSPLFGDSVTPHIICAWDVQDDSLPCYGDSGGPAVRSIGGVERVFGIVAGGLLDGCVLTNQIALFTRVSYYRSFINYSMSGYLAYGYAKLCPGPLSPSLSYTQRQDGRYDVRMTWSLDSAAAQGYRVVYTPYHAMGNNPQRMEVPATQASVMAVLSSGQKFFVTVQGRGFNCDGPFAPLQTVIVP